jgi:predicted nucleic acid-binding protein
MLSLNVSVPDFKEKVLVDTSSFIDYFRYAEGAYIPALALSDSIILSKIVRLELLKGTKRSDRKILLNFLTGLIQIDKLPSAELSESILLSLHSRGLSLGIADLLILSDVIEYQCLLLTTDKKLAQAANILKVRLLD